MSLKKYTAIIAATLLMFGAGLISVESTVGKAGIECLVGFALCSVGFAIALCATMVLLVTRNEERKNEG